MEIVIVLICLVILGYVIYEMFFKEAKSTYDEMKPPTKLPQKENKDRKENKERKDREDD